MDSERSNLLKFVSSQNDHLVKSIIEIEDKKTTDNEISNYKNEQVTVRGFMTQIGNFNFYF